MLFRSEPVIGRLKSSANSSSGLMEIPDRRAPIKRAYKIDEPAPHLADGSGAARRRRFRFRIRTRPYAKPSRITNRHGALSRLCSLARRELLVVAARLGKCVFVMADAVAAAAKVQPGAGLEGGHIICIHCAAARKTAAPAASAALAGATR